MRENAALTEIATAAVAPPELVEWKAFPKELVLVNRAREKAAQGALVTGSSRPTTPALAAMSSTPEANGPTAR
jgi:hypothetical protein